jgi:hypothetical protein
MITPEHIPSFNRLAPYMKADMLMLGRQTNTARYAFPCEYKTLDLDGGDFELDLGAENLGYKPLHDYNPLDERFQTVFNLGTLEHVWDAHTAYVNAASMVAKGGHFLCQAPVAGWEGHAIHITDPVMIQHFFMFNGFEIVESWYTTQAGNPCEAPKRNGGKSMLLWFAARRAVLVEHWRKPSQVYKKGVKPS